MAPTRAQDRRSAPPGHTAPGDPAREAAAKGRAVRVFVSSTFRDMIEDARSSWPSLARLTKGLPRAWRRVRRSGSSLGHHRGAGTAQGDLAPLPGRDQALPPLFIGLLGERYGWMPPPEAYSPALLKEEALLKDDLATRSITELEILHGVLND